MDVGDLVLGDAEEPVFEPAFLAIESAVAVAVAKSDDGALGGLVGVVGSEAESLGELNEHRPVPGIKSLPGCLIRRIAEGGQQGQAGL